MPGQTTHRQLISLAGWVLLSLSAGAIGAVASATAGEFYAALARPAWAPPAWLFAPVWTALYVLMGIAAWLVWRARAPGDSRTPLTLFVVQLAVNALWTWLFFVWHLGALSLAEIVVLWVLIVVVVILFRRVNITAAILLLPYLLWVTFASFLTFAVWQLNPALL